MSIFLFFLTNPIGRLIGVGTIMLSIGLWQGYSIKARLDRSATLQAIIAKKDIDLRAAKDTAEESARTVASLSDTDAKNQEIIRDLESQLSRRPTPQQPAQPQQASGPCALDDATARGLRRLR